jgi:hypothetical protein
VERNDRSLFYSIKTKNSPGSDEKIIKDLSVKKFVS